MSERSTVGQDTESGLCDDCRFVDILTSAKGQRFYRCRRADQDDGFSRYPRLPVFSCQGFEEPPQTTDPEVQT